MHNLLLVAGGGAAGAMARYACTEMMGKEFPWGTLIVNVLGCFALGWLVHVATHSNILSEQTMYALGTGFLGSFTTYSTFGVQTIHAWHRSPQVAVLNVAGHIAFGLLSVLLGIYLATRVHGFWDA